MGKPSRRQSGSVTRLSKRSGESHESMWSGLGLAVGGSLVLGGLLLLASLVQLDSLLVASDAIFNVITGMKQIGLGVGLLLKGLLQMVGFAAVACAALLGVLALTSGVVRIGLRVLPQFKTIWRVLASSLNALTRLIALPHPRSARPAMGTVSAIRDHTRSRAA